MLICRTCRRRPAITLRSVTPRGWRFDSIVCWPCQHWVDKEIVKHALLKGHALPTENTIKAADEETRRVWMESSLRRVSAFRQGLFELLKEWGD